MKSYFLIGGARSGKSRLAQQLAEQQEQPVSYLATAERLDHEMSARIEAHQKSRPSDWPLVEAPLALAGAIRSNATSNKVILVDCLTLWLNNLMYRGDSDLQLGKEIDDLCEAIAQAKGTLIIVSNEVGQGIVADSPLARRFVDQSGWMNQKVAASCNSVALVTAGLPLWLKGGPSS